MTTDAERLQWLEDNLWNGWTVDCYPVAPLPYDGPEPVYALCFEDLEYEGPTLRDAIDRALEADD